MQGRGCQMWLLTCAAGGSEEPWAAHGFLKQCIPILCNFGLGGCA
jgi:hypothetical protein